MASIQSLPSLPSSLKPVSPYMQRASELKVQDPVMAYWCTYYAAQIGLDVKSQEPGAREYLFSLITLLETMKKEVGDNDAVENEDAAAAYVENFGLRVFALADNEDRKGAANRSTARKFLAAANFLELLEIFPKSNGTENNQEKIRYAKWKAADISKALREGRKPTPGPAGAQAEESSPASSSATLQETNVVRIKQQSEDDVPPSAPAHSPAHPQTGAAPQITVKAPQTPPRTYEHLPPGFVPTHSGLASPGSWSTAATPGKEDPDQAELDTRDFASAAQRYGAMNLMQDLPTPSKMRPKATVSGELEGGVGSAVSDTLKPATVVGQAPPPPPPPATLDSPSVTKKVQFSPSVAGGSPPHSPVEKIPLHPKPVEPAKQAEQPLRPLVHRHTPDSAASPTAVIRVSPPKTAAQFAELDRREAESSSRRQSIPSPGPIPIPGPAPSRSSPPLRHSPPTRSSPPSHGTHTPGQPHQRPHGQAGPAFTAPPPPPPVPQPQPPAPPARPSASGSSPPAGLTMAQIAKAQKHCRFAISALEYEDGEQARKELRAALMVLGE